MSNIDGHIEYYAEQFKALSNPHRLALFLRLATCCPPGTVCQVDEAARYCVSQLGEIVDLAPSTVSHHLKELNRAGLIQMARKGKQVECWVGPQVLDQLASFFGGSSMQQP